MPRTQPFLLVLAAMWIATGCAVASSKGTPVQQLPGVAQPEPHGAAKGQLIVETDRLEFSDDTFTYFPHRPYEILDETGRLVRREINHLGEFDETPAMVSLAAGSYQVRARTRSGAIVVRDVAIRAGMLTRTSVADPGSGASEAYAAR